MWIAIRFALLMFALCGLLYPLAMTGLAQVFFPAQANGSLIRDGHGRAIGSALIGQAFIRPEYFHPRPSSGGYDAANSGGYNQGATSRKLVERVQNAALAYQRENALKGRVPVDAVTASGSGLDPHISLANALTQLDRVSAARHADREQICRLVLAHREGGLLTDNPYVSVLALNLALDREFARRNAQARAAGKISQEMPGASDTPLAASQ